MNGFGVMTITTGAFALLSGAALLIFRQRVLIFVRGRYEKVYREDMLSDEETTARLPRMWMLVAIGVGFLFVAALMITVGVLSLTQSIALGGGGIHP